MIYDIYPMIGERIFTDKDRYYHDYFMIIFMTISYDYFILFFYDYLLWLFLYDYFIFFFMIIFVW